MENYDSVFLSIWFEVDGEKEYFGEKQLQKFEFTLFDFTSKGKCYKADVELVNPSFEFESTLIKNQSKMLSLEDDSRDLNDDIVNVMTDKHLTFTEALFILSGLNPISLQKTIKLGSSPDDGIIEHLISDTDTARMLKKCNEN